MDIKAVDFPYTNDITCVSEKQFDVHKTLYSGYVAKANEIHKLLANEHKKTGNTTYSDYRALKKGQDFALNGVLLHELYFSNIGGEHNKCSGEFKERLNDYFGGYENWVDDFKACALSARGWAVLAYEQRSKTFINMLMDAHDEGAIMCAFPLVVLDMYEHACATCSAIEKIVA